MNLKRLRRGIALILVLLSLTLLAWASLPSKREMAMLVLSPFEMKLPSSGAGAAPAILETRRVTLDWPSSMRIGDRETITLSFDVSAQGNPTPGLSPGGSTEGSIPPSTPNVYDTHNVMVEGRFEVAGMRVNPANPVSQSLLEGQPVNFRWEISASQADSHTSAVWLTLHFLPLDGSEASQVPVYARRIMIKVTSLLGMGGMTARLLGGGGVLLSLLIVFDDMIGLFKRWKKQDHFNHR